MGVLTARALRGRGRPRNVESLGSRSVVGVAEPRESGDPRARGPGAVCRPQTTGTAEDSRRGRCPAGSARTSLSVSFRRRDDPTAPCVRRFASERGTSTRTRFEGTPPARSDAPGRRRRPAARRPRARQSNRGTPTPKRERKRGRGRQPPATRREVPRALTRSPPCPLVNRGRARRRARRRRRRNREPPRGPPPPTTTTTTTKTRSPRPHAPGTLKDSIGVVRVPRVCRRLGRGKRARRRRRRRRCAKASGTCAFARREAETVVEGAEAEEEGRDGDEAIITD